LRFNYYWIINFTTNKMVVLLKISFLACLTFVWCVAVSSAAEPTKQHELVHEYTKCRSDKSRPVEMCLRGVLRKMPNYFKTPLPALSMPRMDPFFKKEMIMEFKVLGNVEGESSEQNVTFRGMNKQTVQSIVNEGNGRYTIRSKLPNLRWSGRYRMMGKVMGFDIHADSTFYVVLNHVDATHKFTIRRSADKQTYRLEDNHLQFEVQDGRVRMNNMIGDDGSYLGDTINEILSVNLKGLLESTNDAWAPHLVNLFDVPINSFLKHLPQSLAAELSE